MDGKGSTSREYSKEKDKKKAPKFRAFDKNYIENQHFS